MKILKKNYKISKNNYFVMVINIGMIKYNVYQTF